MKIWVWNFRTFSSNFSGPYGSSDARDGIYRLWVSIPCLLMAWLLTGFPQKSQKKVPWFFHDFSRPKSKFPDKRKNVSICRINYRQTQIHTHTQTWFDQGQPTIQLILPVTELFQKSKLHLLISLKWVTDFPINIWKMISHFHTDFILNTVIIIL